MMSNAYLLGIDVGTTGTKSILFQVDGTVIHSAYRGYETTHPRPCYAEQNAEDWWNALVETVREVTKGIAPETVLALSVSTQGGTLIPADSSGNPIVPAIVWSDERCAEEFQIIDRAVGAETVYQKTGWNLENGLNALQILWLKRNQPEIFKQTELFLSVPDFIHCRLTGIAAIDACNGGINQLLDIHTLTWDSNILQAIGITEKKLPRLVLSGEPIGPLTSSAAAILGLTAKTVVVAGGHDQYCAALGVGAIRPGDCVWSTGTAWVVTGIRQEPCREPSVRVSQSRHVVPGYWGSLLSLPSGGSCLEWIRNKAGFGEPPSYAEMDAICAGRENAATRLLFYPYMASCRYPLSEREKKAVFYGLSPAHDWFDMAKAVMEGVAFQAVWMSGAVTGENCSAVTLTGGAAKSSFWAQLVADIAGVPVKIPAVIDAGCVGAAILAGVGRGYFTYEEGCAAFCVQGKTICPGEHTGHYQSAMEDYRRIFDQLFGKER